MKKMKLLLIWKCSEAMMDFLKRFVFKLILIVVTCYEFERSFGK